MAVGVPGSDMQPAEQPAADTLLDSLKTIDASGRRRHATVLDYWLSIRGDREFPPLHDLDPLQISDAGPCSILLELVGGGEDAEIRHIGEALKTDVAVERIADAPRPSILSCIAKKLSIVAISRTFLAFEDQFLTADTVTRCWVTLLPLSSAGAWVDYVYAFVTFETVAAEAIVETSAEAKVEASDEASVEVEPETPPETPPEAHLETAETLEILPNDVEESTAIPPIESQEAESAPDDVEPATEAADEASEPAPAEPDAAEAAETTPGFSGLAHDPATADGFYGAATVKAAPTRPAAPPANEKPAEPLELSARASDGALHAKLAAVRAKTEEARMAKLRSNTALYEGLSAAYDFALDAEDSSEEYLKLVEAQGLKIKLRSPMLPVMKLAFAGMCDDPTIARLEAVLAWALKQELPRGSLAARIEAEGGIARILSGEADAK
jgi:hypothetical protein